MRLMVAAAVLLAGGVARAQEPPPVLEASFEAATLKRNIEGGNTSLNAPVTGRFAVTNFPLGTLIGVVYQRTTQRVVGIPDWARDERYDIVALLNPQIAARLQPDGHPPIWALAVRRLLADRAKLAVHSETRQLPIYALVKARADGKPGPNLRPAAADCDALRTQSQAAARTGQPSPYPPATETYVPCGMRNNAGRIISGGFGLGQLLATLTNLTGRQVRLVSVARSWPRPNPPEMMRPAMLRIPHGT